MFAVAMTGMGDVEEINGGVMIQSDEFLFSDGSKRDLRIVALKVGNIVRLIGHDYDAHAIAAVGISFREHLTCALDHMCAAEYGWHPDYESASRF